MYSFICTHLEKYSQPGLSHLINYERFHFKKENGALKVENKERKAVCFRQFNCYAVSLEIT